MEEEEEGSGDKLPSREAIRWTLLLSLQTGGWKTKKVKNRKRAVLTVTVTV